MGQFSIENRILHEYRYRGNLEILEDYLEDYAEEEIEEYINPGDELWDEFIMELVNEGRSVIAQLMDDEENYNTFFNDLQKVFNNNNLEETQELIEWYMDIFNTNFFREKYEEVVYELKEDEEYYNDFLKEIHELLNTNATNDEIKHIIKINTSSFSTVIFREKYKEAIDKMELRYNQ